MGRRTWIKTYCDKWLRGSLREETLEFRGAWIDLLHLAGDSAYGDHGVIAISADMGFSDKQIASILHAPLEQWMKHKQRMVSTDRITVDELNVLQITNWKRYQSEYERQKPYRENAQVTPESYNEELRRKLHGEGEREGERERVKNKSKIAQMIEARFDAFWTAYPRKRNKGQAMKAWKKLRPSTELHNRILAAVEKQKASLEWRREGGKYIPYPGKWLNGECWLDEIGQAAAGSQDQLNTMPTKERVKALKEAGLRPRTDEECYVWCQDMGYEYTDEENKRGWDWYYKGIR